VVHVDGTGRLQTVTREAAPSFHELLEAYESRTGVPLLVNTSFNATGDPIVETPADAAWCLATTELDRAVIDGVVCVRSLDVDQLLELVPRRIPVAPGASRRRNDPELMEIVARIDGKSRGIEIADDLALHSLAPRAGPAARASLLRAYRILGASNAIEFL
jgi:hypothetical protein